MLSTMKPSTRVWVLILPILLVLLAIVVFLMLRPIGQSISSSAPIPVTGNELSSGSSSTTIGMSQRSLDAYSARLSAAAGQPVGMNRRSMSAYAARMDGQAGIMSQRAQDAYSKRMEALGAYYQALTEK